MLAERERITTTDYWNALDISYNFDAVYDAVYDVNQYIQVQMQNSNICLIYSHLFTLLHLIDPSGPITFSQQDQPQSIGEGNCRRRSGIVGEGNGLSHPSSPGVFSPWLCDDSLYSQRVYSLIGFTSVRFFLHLLSASTGEFLCVFIELFSLDWLTL